MSGSSPVGDGCAASQIASAIVTPSMWSMISPYSSLQSLGNGNCTKLRAFTVGGCRWFIEYCPNGCCADDSDWISVRVCRDDTSDAKDVTVYVMISLLYPHEKTVSSKTSDTLGFNGRCGFHRLIRMKYLENSMFFGDDSLIVMCHITVVTETPATQFVVARPSDLHQHLLGLLTSGQGGEVTFVVGGETFAAHRYMLATRSSVFMAGLFGPMKKKKKKTATTIRIDGMEAKVFKAMLHYIYTDSFPKFEAGETMEMAQHLLVAADRYNIEGLKLICEDTLRCYIGTSTAATMLALAEQHSCHELREACFKFMSSLNNLKAVMATYGFKHLKSVCPSILEELVAKVISL